MIATYSIDIKENNLRNKGDLLEILLIDHTTKKNVIWGTDSYSNYGKGFKLTDRIMPELVTGKYGELIQPRAIKSLTEQKQRTKDRAEVFTPLKVVDQMNKLIDWSGDIKVTSDTNWKEYVRELKLEISCGEAPFIVSRYNPVAHTGKLIVLQNRVGFLDRKLRVVSRYCNKPKDWVYWAKEAYKSSYGYEWQGDNILIARENLLYSMIDYYVDKFGRKPSILIQREFAEIISWNIFQMDGMKYVIPMSCTGEAHELSKNLSLFDQNRFKIKRNICKGCLLGNHSEHDGKYVKIKDWNTDKTMRFVDII